MWFWFVAGLTLGWLIEWLIDWTFWRRAVLTPTIAVETVRADLAQARQTIRTQEARIYKLETRLAELELDSITEIKTSSPLAQD